MKNLLRMMKLFVILSNKNKLLLNSNIISMKREKETIRESIKNIECRLIIAIDKIINSSYEKFIKNDEIVCYIIKQK